MAKSKLAKANEKIAEGVVGGYKKVEESVVGAYKKIVDKFVDNFLKGKNLHKEIDPYRCQSVRVKNILKSYPIFGSANKTLTFRWYIEIIGGVLDVQNTGGRGR